MVLSVDQKDAVAVLKWLIDGPRMAGRSVAIAYYLVEKAVVTGDKVKLFDHSELLHGIREPHSRKYILETCKQIAKESYPEYDLNYHRLDDSIFMYKRT